jgi:hypothetical protein
MSEHAGSESAAHSSASAAVVGGIVLGAVLVGVGITGIALWLITNDWLYFAGTLSLLAGALVLFSRLSGPDHA